MRICVLCHRYPYKDHTVHVFVKNLVDQWALMGHQCVVISPLSMVHTLAGKEKAAPKVEHQKVAEGITVDVFRPRYYTVPKLSILGISLNEYCVQRCIEKTIGKNKLHFDVVYCHFFKMASVGWHYGSRHNIPFFVATGESRILPLKKPCPSFSIEKMRDTLSGVVAVSIKNKWEAVQMGYANEHDIEVFPNGTNLETFHRMDKTQCRKELNLPLDKFIIICVGQFIERKGQRRILDAIDRLNNKNIATIFVGKGDDAFEHESIVFKGTVKNDKLPFYLNAADVFVLPTREEGCCNAIIEALACGLPIVSSDKPFNHDVLNRENAILVNPDDINEIATAINDLYQDKELRERIAQKSLETGASLSISRRASNIIGFIQEKMQTCAAEKMKMYYNAHTNKDNLGDLLITKYQIEEYAKHGDVFVDCHGMPSDFRRVIFDTQSPSVKDFEREYGICYRSIKVFKVISTLNRQGFTHFCDAPGPRVPFRRPLYRMFSKFLVKVIPPLFLSKRIKRFSLGTDLYYHNKGVTARLTKWSFSKIDVLGIRSMANLEALQKVYHNVVYVPDMAFLYPKFTSSLFESKRNRIALSFRKVENYHLLVKAMQSICMVAEKQGTEVDVLYQVEVDKTFCKQLCQDMKSQNIHFIEKPIDFYSIETYQRYDIVCSNRLHVLLMAAMNGAIPYGLISHDRKENKIKDIFSSVFTIQLLSYIEEFDENKCLSMNDNLNAAKNEVRTCVSKQQELCQKTISNLFGQLF